MRPKLDFDGSGRLLRCRTYTTGLPFAMLSSPPHPIAVKHHLLRSGFASRFFSLTSLILLVLTSGAAGVNTPVDAICDRYLDKYFRTFPTRATEAGRHEFDEDVEDLSPDSLSSWVAFNHQTLVNISEALAREPLRFDDELDAEALVGQIQHELNEHERLQRPNRDPLYWSSIVENAVVFLMVRDDLPLRERQRRAKVRADQLPRLAQQAEQAFSSTDRSLIAPELCALAASQLQASGKFYRTGFANAVGGQDGVGSNVAEALEHLARFFEGLEQQAKGSPRLLGNYAATFRSGTRVQQSVSELLAQADADLIAKRQDAAAFGRQVWRELMGDRRMPLDDKAVLRELFNRIGADQPSSMEDYLGQWRDNVRRLETFVRTKRIISLPGPLTLMVDRSPTFFIGQSVGGVYPPGPYAPDANTILFLPMPSENAAPEQRRVFFSAFNVHFNKMIVPHELIPGHYVQFKIAVHQPHKIRVVFPDPVYVEGWGTFCERLLLDEGWGGPAERLAHLKKQLENIARTIVDIRVHTQNMSREEVIRFVKDEALQDDQFASNMWTRAITTSPQITTYYLGYRKLHVIFDEARARAGDKFDLQRFMDGMMELGPVRLDHYAAKFQNKGAEPFAF